MPYPYSPFVGEFPGFGLVLVPDVVVPEAEQGCTWIRNLDPYFCPCQDMNLALVILAAANVSTRPPCTPYIYICVCVYIRVVLICKFVRN